MKNTMKQALEVLKKPWKAGPDGVADAIIALEEALAKQGEPVAWMRTSGTGSPVVTEELLVEMPEMRWNFQQPLYTTPQQRKWVGLNWDDLPEPYVGDTAFMNGAKWAEAKLKGKNT